MKNKYVLPGFGILALAFLSAAWIISVFSSHQLPFIAQKASVQLNEKSSHCLLQLEQLLLIDSLNDQQGFIDQYKEEQVGFYLLEKDSLIFWNNAEMPLDLNLKDFSSQEGLIKNRHGYYVYFKLTTQNRTALALCLIKPLYDLENNYLKNDFSEWTSIPGEVKIELDNLNEHPVTLHDVPLFALKSGEEMFYNKAAVNGGFICYLLAWICFLFFVLVLIDRNGKPAVAALSVIGVIGLRLFVLLGHFPEFIYHTDLYDVKLFGNAQSRYNAFLGDIVINAMLFLFFSFALRLIANKNKGKKTTPILILSSLLLVMHVLQFDQTASSLVTNSTLNFDFINIFSLRFPVFIALGALGIYFIGFFISVVITISLFSVRSKNQLARFTLLYLGLTVCLYLVLPGATTFQVAWPWMYAMLLYSLSVYVEIRTPYLFGMQLVFMSFIISVYFNSSISQNQKEDLEILSLKLSEKQDAILENEFEGIPQRMKKDENLANLIDFLSAVPSAAKETELLLKQKYFSGYFDRFTIDFALFNKNCEPMLQAKQAVLNNQGFFEDQINYYSEPAAADGLFYVKNNKENSRYIGRIELKDKQLFVLIEPKQFEELGSFPDLLLDQSQQKPEKLKAFSHAVYRLQQISNRYGEFNYPLFMQDSLVLHRANSDFIHHYYKPDEVTDVIISEHKKNWNYFFTFNSYLLLFFSFLAYLAYLLYSVVFTNNFSSPTLTRRIQTIIIALLFLAMSAVGITSGALVSRQFESDNKKQLEEKTQIIISELNAQFKSEQIFDEVQKEMINLKLKEYARLFNTPISLFSKNGTLFNTSETKFYDLGLAAPHMNPSAFLKLSQNYSSSETVNENAGKLTYLSHYAPLFDTHKHVIGFLNLPYFAKQSDLLKELSGIISALINVYVILFVISILAGLILSGFITQPLRFIKQQLAHISLGKRNEKIVWQSDDEVGKLVSEYNLMLQKLEKSAELLAQSERESAWREMAKQVAHEIKNPLTPMKLNIQYLQLLIKNDAPDFKERFEKASAGIIEQIDSLANIAGAFSSFAKLPGTQLQTINLVEIINASVMLFENQKNIQILNTITRPEILVKGDRDQCLRVFNNVFKNASQALESTQMPRIEISCQLSNNKAVIQISDNGCGIPDNLHSKIFTPNFTTKTSGSGLGLAMVRSSMLGFEGDVRFSSQAEKGTTFYLEFSLISVS